MEQTEYKYMQCDEAGRSMVEIIGVLAVMGLITAGGMALYRSGMAAQKRSRSIDEVTTIAENIRSLFAESRDFSGLTNDKDVGTQLIDGFYLNTTTPYGSDTRYSVTVNPGDDESFAVYMEGLDEADCTLLASQVWPDALGVSCTMTGKVGTLFLVFGK